MPPPLTNFKLPGEDMVFDNFEVMAAEEALTKYASLENRAAPTARLDYLLRSYDPIAKAAIVESDYVDVDDSASYHDQRGRSFTPSERSTTRIHFFTEEFTESDLIDPSEHTIRSMAATYLGFTVVRPGQEATLGRTLISCPSSVSGYPARFPTRGTTRVDLAGIPLEIESCPYMSQDGKIMACATAAIWMSTTPLAEKISGLATHTTAEITSLAMSLNRPFGPSIGRRGLSVQEMEQALLRIGFDPRMHVYPQLENLLENCHLFSDSGIPPILIINVVGSGRHAVTVVGYTLKSSSDVEDTAPVSSSSPAHKFVSNLIIHDDQRGMYLPVEVAEVKSDSSTFTELSIPWEHGVSKAICEAILIPFPRRLMLDAEEVTGKAEEWISFAKQERLIEDRPVVYRTLLVRSNVLKQTLLKKRGSGDGATGYPRGLVAFTRALPMPRYVWLIEVSYQDEWDPSSPSSPPVIADFVVDSTSIEITDLNYLMLHFPGTALGLQVAGNSAQHIKQGISPDYPHPPFPDIPRP